MLVCVFFPQFCTRDRGCSAHPAFPAPSFSKRLRQFLAGSDASRRENAEAVSFVIASAAKQSTYRRAAMDRFASLAMTVARIRGYCRFSNQLQFWKSFSNGRYLGSQIRRRVIERTVAGRRRRPLLAAVAADAVGVEPRGPRDRRHRRRRHFRADRARRRVQCRTRCRAVVHIRRGGLHLRRAVLRRDGFDRAGQRQRLYLCLCDARRTGRLDHRLGPDPRICGRRHHGRDRLVRICRQSAKDFGLVLPARFISSPLAYDAASQAWTSTGRSSMCPRSRSSSSSPRCW